MIRTLTSLLLSTTLLLVGHGMQLTLLPLRAAALGHSDLQIALSGSAYFGGFVLGCFFVPRLVTRVGHIRSFAVLASAMISILLFLGLSASWPLWLVLRALIGFSISGLYSVIESWLNDQATSENRGVVLSVYTFLVLSAMALGQQLVNVAPLDSATPFMLLVSLIALSIIPVSSTRKLAPAAVESTRVRLRLLMHRSPAAVAGAFISGAVTGSFWTLGAIFAQRSLDSISAATKFMSIAILGGAMLQYPFGWLSDRLGRLQVLTLLMVLATGACGLVATASGESSLLIAVFAFGATTMPLYSMSLAMAADNSLRHEFIEMGTSVLLLNAVGAVIAPLGLGELMGRAGDRWLFLGSAALCGAGALLLVTLRWRTAPVEDTVPFSAAASEMAPTSFDLDPRAPEDATGDLVPAEEAPSFDDARELEAEESPRNECGS